ncbi:uncharacterized protein LOC130172559 isoform X3 [Seriola aureovittata]|uniref:uncharacterized protein LOC130172559 isoform X3 n=1 Tax=Seriola aureovittata TaxID=2871759 RepID=UPI0024BDC2DA|nr:uncharacterized protein LOC130172559 isoform X3 [Seriola aureovittata]
MKLIVWCLLLLPFATVVLTAPVRDRRENFISFLNDALGAMTTPAYATANRNPTSKPVTDKDSEDKGLESHEIWIPEVMVNDNTPSGRKKGVGKDSVGPVDVSRRLVQDLGSREPTDLDSEEGMTVVAQEDGNLSGKQVIRLSGDKVIDSASQGANLQGKVRRVNGLIGVLAPGQSREMQDWDSAEDNNGRLPAVGNTRDTDETREYISSETYPIGRIFFSSISQYCKYIV